jgi:hypothetical protein
MIASPTFCHVFLLGPGNSVFSNHGLLELPGYRSEFALFARSHVCIISSEFIPGTDTLPTVLHLHHIVGKRSHNQQLCYWLLSALIWPRKPTLSQQRSHVTRLMLENSYASSPFLFFS